MVARPYLKVGVLLAILLLITFVALTREPGPTAYSCRGLKSCLGRDKPHTYEYEPKIAPTITSTEIVLHDGTRQFDRIVKDSQPDILFLVLTRDAGSWSADFIAEQRTAYDFLDILVGTKLNLTDVSLSLLTSEESEFAKLKLAVSTLPFGRVTLFYQPDQGPSFSYKERHKPAVQLARRSKLAKLRNYLMLRALQDESHVVWVDADVAEFSPNIVQTMVNHSMTLPDAGIITARTQVHVMPNYDKNCWSVDRSIESVLGTVTDDVSDAAVQKLIDTRIYIPEIIAKTTNSDIKPLDAVGGTILYIRSDLVRQGVSFPWFNVALCAKASASPGSTSWAPRGSTKAGSVSRPKVSVIQPKRSRARARAGFWEAIIMSDILIDFGEARKAKQSVNIVQ